MAGSHEVTGSIPVSSTKEKQQVEQEVTHVRPAFLSVVLHYIKTIESKFITRS